MRKYILLFLGLLMTMPLWAEATKTASWQIPTQRVNGDALSIEEIAGYDLVCQRVDGGEVVYTLTDIPATDTSHVTPAVFDAGDFICRMRTHSADGLQSTWGESNVFTVGRCDVTDCSPMPPSSIVIQLQ